LANRPTFNAADHPVKVSAFVLVVSTIALTGFINPAMLLQAESETYLPRQLRTTEESSSATEDSSVRLTDSDVVIVVDSQQFFTPEGSLAIRHAVQSLRELDIVEDVFWLDEAPVVNLFSLRNPVFPPGTASARQFALAREKALANPLIRGQLLSDDVGTLL